jgi:hypothetical protein
MKAQKGPETVTLLNLADCPGQAYSPPVQKSHHGLRSPSVSLLHLARHRTTSNPTLNEKKNEKRNPPQPNSIHAPTPVLNHPSDRPRADGYGSQAAPEPAPLMITRSAPASVRTPPPCKDHGLVAAQQRGAWPTCRCRSRVAGEWRVSPPSQWLSCSTCVRDQQAVRDVAASQVQACRAPGKRTCCPCRATFMLTCMHVYADLRFDS